MMFSKGGICFIVFLDAESTRFDEKNLVSIVINDKDVINLLSSCYIHIIPKT